MPELTSDIATDLAEKKRLEDAAQKNRLDRVYPVQAGLGGVGSSIQTTTMPTAYAAYNEALTTIDRCEKGIQDIERQIEVMQKKRAELRLVASSALGVASQMLNQRVNKMQGHDNPCTDSPY